MYRARRHGIVAGTVALLLTATMAVPARGADPTDGGLAERFPESLDGRPVEVEILSGPRWVARWDPSDPVEAGFVERVEDLLQTVGRSLDDLTIATAVHEPTAGDVSRMAAIRVQGSQASELVDPTIRYLLDIQSPQYASVDIPGRMVEPVREEMIPGEAPVVLYAPPGDTLWVVDARDPLLTEIVTALPDPGGRVEVPELGIAATFPATWNVFGMEPMRVEEDPGLFSPAELLGPDDAVWDVMQAGSEQGGECSLQLYESSQLTLQAIADWYSRWEFPWPGIESEVVGVEWRDDIAAGDAVAFQITLYEVPEKPKKAKKRPKRRPVHAFAQYAIDGGDTIAMIRCAGQPPADRWLPAASSVAEAVEFLPEDDSATDAARPDASLRPPIPSAGCSTTDVRSGGLGGAMTVAGLERSWELSVPSVHDGQTPIPLVFTLHGNDVDGDDQGSALARYGASSDANGFVVVAPRARTDPTRWMWELDGDLDLSMANPDIAFVDALIDRLGDELCLDLARVYASGLGDGGSGASALACALPDRIAASAAVAGLADHGEVCGSVRPVPIVAIHGRKDKVMSYGGGFGKWIRSTSPTGQPFYELPIYAMDGWMYDLEQRAENVAWHNGCQRIPTQESLDKGVERYRWPCPAGAEVELVAHGGRHAWDVKSKTLDTNELTWEFFEQHPMPVPMPQARPSLAAVEEIGPQPMPIPTTEALVAGLVTEEVEPGVLRIVNDGVRDLSGKTGRLVAGLDGSVWLFAKDAYFRLGDVGHSWARDDRVTKTDIEVAPDGTVWGVGLGQSEPGRPRQSHLYSFDGEEWTIQLSDPKRGEVLGVEVQPDGSVLASIRWGREQPSAAEPGGTSIAELGGRRPILWPDSGDAWSTESVLFSVEDMWAVGDELWVETREPSATYLYGAGLEGPAARLPRRARWLDVGPDGTLWLGRAGRSDAAKQQTRLSRFDGKRWVDMDRVVHEDHQDVGPDGSLWAVPRSDPPARCNGIASFDGTTWTEYLDGHCVRDIEVAPDGTVWLQARASGGTIDWKDTGPVETYVIQPGAAASIE